MKQEIESAERIRINEKPKDKEYRKVSKR